MRKSEFPVDRLAPASIDSQQIIHFIEDDRYTDIAKILEDAEARVEDSNKILGILLSVAELTCQAAVQCTNELAWLRQAESQATERVSEYKAALSEIFELINEIKKAQTEPQLYSYSSSLVDAALTPSIIENHGTPRKALNLLNYLRSLLTGQSAPAVSARTTQSVSAVMPNEVDNTPQTGGAPRLVIYCLGAFKVYRDHCLINSWRGLKGLSILKYLLHHRQVSVPKDVLMDIFWPDAPPEAARRNLHQAIYSIRRTLKEGQPDFQSIIFENDCYVLDPNITVWTDSDEFNRRVRAGMGLEKNGNLAEALVEYSIAEGLYQGDFLEEDLYEEWTMPLRQQFRDAYLDLADRLSECYLQQAEYTAAMALCRKIIKTDRCQESAYRRLMKCYLAQGQRHLAIRQYLTCLEALRDDLNLAPSEETATLYRGLVQA